MPCSADASQVCGGANRLTVYTNGDFIEPAIQESSGNYIALGCFKEGKTERVLSSYSFEDSEMTPDQCVETCNGRGYAFAGVEYSTECYCASHPSNQTMEVDISQCDMKCGGNRKAFCGGADRLVIYTDLGENVSITSIQ